MLLAVSSTAARQRASGWRVRKRQWLVRRGQDASDELVEGGGHAELEQVCCESMRVLLLLCVAGVESLERPSQQAGIACTASNGVQCRAAARASVSSGRRGAHPSCPTRPPPCCAASTRGAALRPRLNLVHHSFRSQCGTTQCSAATRHSAAIGTRLAEPSPSPHCIADCTAEQITRRSRHERSSRTCDLTSTKKENSS